MRFLPSNFSEYKMKKIFEFFFTHPNIHIYVYMYVYAFLLMKLKQQTKKGKIYSIYLFSYICMYVCITFRKGEGTKLNLSKAMPSTFDHKQTADHTLYKDKATFVAIRNTYASLRQYMSVCMCECIYYICICVIHKYLCVAFHETSPATNA